MLVAEGHGNDKAYSVVGETYDTRKVGGADVARVRWRYYAGGGAEDDVWTGNALPRQLAVTDAGA